MGTCRQSRFFLQQTTFGKTRRDTGTATRRLGLMTSIRQLQVSSGMTVAGRLRSVQGTVGSLSVANSIGRRRCLRSSEILGVYLKARSVYLVRLLAGCVWSGLLPCLRQRFGSTSTVISSIRKALRIRGLMRGPRMNSREACASPIFLTIENARLFTAERSGGLKGKGRSLTAAPFQFLLSGPYGAEVQVYCVSTSKPSENSSSLVIFISSRKAPANSALPSEVMRQRMRTLWPA